MARKSIVTQRKSKVPVKQARPSTARGKGLQHRNFYQSITKILRTAQSKAYRAINFAMVEAYWNIGRRIVEEEQKGKGRADYGTQLIQQLSERLRAEFGSGFSVQSLWNMRQFYQCAPILSAVRRELTWTHYKIIIRIENEKARAYYIQEAADQCWSTRALERQVNSLYYERLLMSRDKPVVASEMKQKTAALSSAPHDFIKDPYVLEFLGLNDNPNFRERELERSIISKLQSFMLELGRGFAFVARQQRISTETKEFFVDLVFYNYILKCFVLIDLKTSELTHQDIGQMDMYVRLFEDTIKGKDDNPTVGIILCTETDQTVVKYSVMNENKRLFASKYMLYLPTEETLRQELERERAMIVQEQEERYGKVLQ